MKQGLLVTADGAVFRGRSVGVGGFTTGEAVFNTAMTGYQEIITDPSYAGQVVVLTAPHVGNYGVTAFDNQSAVVHAQSLITRAATRHGIPCVTTAAGALALVSSIAATRDKDIEVTSLQDYHTTADV